jgi:8-oxo-dGTP pyrophosphatase MutT (NUDIX family)
MKRMTVASVQQTLARRKPKISDLERPVRAAVALLLREGAQGLEMLFIERAACDNDPWSGNLAFPGGKVEASDPDVRTTAERETEEELGIDLSRARYLGRLSDLVAATLPVLVSCFVYGLEGSEPLRLSDEVRDAFWVPLVLMEESERHVVTTVEFRDVRAPFPALRLLPSHRPVLWGLTYRLVMQFFEVMGVRVAAAADDPESPPGARG